MYVWVGDFDGFRVDGFLEGRDLMDPRPWMINVGRESNTHRSRHIHMCSCIGV